MTNEKLARPGPARPRHRHGPICIDSGTRCPVNAHTTGLHDNCTKLNEKRPHGVGTRNAVDKTSGTRVKNFYHNNDAYWRAERHNPDLDRDNDRIACEQA